MSPSLQSARILHKVSVLMVFSALLSVCSLAQGSSSQAATQSSDTAGPQPSSGTADGTRYLQVYGLVFSLKNGDTWTTQTDGTVVINHTALNSQGGTDQSCTTTVPRSEPGMPTTSRAKCRDGSIFTAIGSYREGGISVALHPTGGGFNYEFFKNSGGTVVAHETGFVPEPPGPDAADNALTHVLAIVESAQNQSTTPPAAKQDTGGQQSPQTNTPENPSGSQSSKQVEKSLADPNTGAAPKDKAATPAPQQNASGRVPDANTTAQPATGAADDFSGVNTTNLPKSSGRVDFPPLATGYKSKSLADGGLLVENPEHQEFYYYLDGNNILQVEYEGVAPSSPLSNVSLDTSSFSDEESLKAQLRSTTASDSNGSSTQPAPASQPAPDGTVFRPPRNFTATVRPGNLKIMGPVDISAYNLNLNDLIQTLIRFEPSQTAPNVPGVPQNLPNQREKSPTIDHPGTSQPGSGIGVKSGFDFSLRYSIDFRLRYSRVESNNAATTTGPDATAKPDSPSTTNQTPSPSANQKGHISFDHAFRDEFFLHGLYCQSFFSLPPTKPSSTQASNATETDCVNAFGPDPGSLRVFIKSPAGVVFDPLERHTFVCPIQGAALIRSDRNDLDGVHFTNCLPAAVLPSQIVDGSVVFTIAPSTGTGVTGGSTERAATNEARASYFRLLVAFPGGNGGQPSVNPSVQSAPGGMPGRSDSNTDSKLDWKLTVTPRFALALASYSPSDLWCTHIQPPSSGSGPASNQSLTVTGPIQFNCFDQSHQDALTLVPPAKATIDTSKLILVCNTTNVTDTGAGGVTFNSCLQGAAPTPESGGNWVSLKFSPTGANNEVAQREKYVPRDGDVRHRDFDYYDSGHDLVERSDRSTIWVDSDNYILPDSVGNNFIANGPGVGFTPTNDFLLNTVNTALNAVGIPANQNIVVVLIGAPAQGEPTTPGATSNAKPGAAPMSHRYNGHVELAAYHPRDSLFGFSPRGLTGRPIAEDSQASAFGQAIYSIVANGNSSGKAAELQVFDPTGKIPNPALPEGTVLEPVKLGSAKSVAELKPGAKIIRKPVGAYCVDYLKPPPEAGMLYRVAPPNVQAQYGDIAPVVQAGRELADEGAFTADSDPETYNNSIRQYSLWVMIQHLTQQQFAEVFLEKTKQNAAAAGMKWTKAMEKSLLTLVPGRWRDIQLVQQRAAEIVKRRQSKSQGSRR